MRSLPWKKRRCKICGATGFDGFTEFMKHRKEAHSRSSLEKALIATSELTQAAMEAKELQYSFYNSPRELRLDLGEYVIRVERKLPIK